LAATIYLTFQLGAPEGQVFALLWGINFRITVFLYLFAFLDAFFTAREMTAGTDAFIAESPRVAAILNLLTRGFGYFYLGKRTLGFVIFIGFGFFQRIIMQSMTHADSAGAGFFLEFVQIGLAADAYRIAREREKQILATVQLPASPISTGLPTAIPIALALLLVAGYFALSASGLFLPDYSHIDQSAARVSHDVQGVNYQNPAYGVAMRAPNSWTIEREPSYFALAIRADHGCSASLRPYAWSPLLGLDSYKGQLSYQLSKEKNTIGKVVDDHSAVLSGLRARDIRLFVKQDKNLLVEHHVIARKGMTLYVLSTYELAIDEQTSADPSCSSDLGFIRTNLLLPH
jgi:hypothetical protein